MTADARPHAQITKSRWHVPTQVFGSALALLGFFLGHAHGGREFVGGNVHSSFATVLQLLLVAQVVLGLYLKGHWERGVNGKIRKLIRPCHSVIGKAMPLLAWTQMIFGGITALGFCQGDHLGQCLAHFIMGSAFVAYAVLLTIILLVGQVWMRRSGRSQEFFDSAVIAAWGCVNTFTEHRWGTAWVKNDWQHTTMGIIWWCAGLAGMFISRDRDGNPKRNFVPGFVIFMTGWAMSAHPQDLMVSAMTHSMFGKTLMAAGLTRIIEIAFVLRDKQSITDDGRSWNSFQYIPVFVSTVGGLARVCRSTLTTCSSCTPRAFCSWVRPKSKWSSWTSLPWTTCRTSSSSTLSPFSSSSSPTCSSTSTTVSRTPRTPPRIMSAGARGQMSTLRIRVGSETRKSLSSTA